MTGITPDELDDYTNDPEKFYAECIEADIEGYIDACNAPLPLSNEMYAHIKAYVNKCMTAREGGTKHFNHGIKLLDIIREIGAHANKSITCDTNGDADRDHELDDNHRCLRCNITVVPV